MDKYDVVRDIILSHPDKQRILKVLNLCDDPKVIPVVTRLALAKRVRIARNILENILYLLYSIGMLNYETVGRAAVYTITSEIGGRFLDELRGVETGND